MVRLKLNKGRVNKTRPDQSQFHYGSIKTLELMINISTHRKSQFHYGSIKTMMTPEAADFLWGLNSTMVRLKLNVKF